MSAEGKKKRGEAGVSNARNIAFRYGGSKCDLSTKLGSTQHPRLAGAKLLHTLEFARLLPHFHPSERMLKAADAIIDHLTINHPQTASGREWLEAAE